MSKNRSLPSTLAARILGYVVLAILSTAVFFLPRVIDWYLLITGREHFNTAVIYTLFYCALIPAFTAIVFLLFLLKKADNLSVFSSAALKDLNILSVCCFSEAVIFGILTYYFYFSALIAFAAFFMGLLLQTVKNVIAYATELKAENDYTI